MLFNEKLGHASYSVGHFSILYCLDLLIATFSRSGALRVVTKIHSAEDLAKQFWLYIVMTSSLYSAQVPFQLATIKGRGVHVL